MALQHTDLRNRNDAGLPFGLTSGERHVECLLGLAPGHTRATAQTMTLREYRSSSTVRYNYRSAVGMYVMSVIRLPSTTVGGRGIEP